MHSMNISDGNKGVISIILPDHEMPRTEDGEYAEAVCNSLGVVGRLNPSQLYEHELNFIADQLRKRHLLNGDYESFVEDISKFYKIACPEYLKYLQSLSDETFDELFAEMYKTGDIYIHQAPFFGNANVQTLMKLYKLFKVKKVKFDGIQEPLVFGKLYFVK